MNHRNQRRKERRAFTAAVLVAAVGGGVLYGQALVAPKIIAPNMPQPQPPAVEPPTTGPGAALPSRPGDPPLPGNMMDQAAAGMQVSIDDSFASVDRVWNAIRLQRNGQSREAIEAYQKVVEEFGQKLLFLNDNSYVPITDYVRDRLLEMPAVRNGMYDQLFGADARKGVESAIEERDLPRLLSASDRYYPSSAALKGLSQAAEWYFERGEFSAAADHWRKLLRHPLAGSMQADLLFRAAVAQKLAGNGTSAAEMRARLAKDFADAEGVVSGKEVKLLPRLDEILAMASWEKSEVPGEEWPAFGGGPSRNSLLKTNASIGARLWSVPLGAAVAAGQGVANGQPQAIITTSSLITMTNDGSMLPSHPVMSNGSLFIHNGNQILSISANAGNRQWVFPASVSVPAAAATRTRITGHDSVAVQGDHIFAMLPSSTGAVVQYDSTGMPSFANRIVCISREDGREVWSRSASEIKTERDGSELRFIGSPIVTRSGVYTMARRTSSNNFSQQYLVRLDRETGAPTWSCYLCSTSMTNAGGGLAQVNYVPIPSLVDDVLYISTGQGADCAVDANVGRILWMRISPRPRTAVTSSSLAPSWRFNPPLVVGEKLLVAEAGRGLRVFNRTTGKLLREYAVSELIDPARSAGVSSSVDVLAGAVGGKVIMTMGYVSVCFDEKELEKDSPKPEWRETISGIGRPLGRPFLSESGYYVPFEQKLVRFDVKSGLSEPWNWPETEAVKPTPGRPGNLLVTSEQVIVVNDTEVAGYSKWETARDNRLAKIAANPRDPQPYLALAEISFRTNHHELSQENMKKSVELANAGNVPSGRNISEMLDQLYRTNLAFAEQLLVRDDNELRDTSRFYYELSRATARKPEQQAEWRMRLAELSNKQKKLDEAVTLYSEILADPAVRQASYREGDVTQTAGAAAEQHIRELKERDASVYQRFEEQAVSLTQRGSTQRDPALLQQVIDAFPNSAASVQAAQALAAIYIDKGEWENSRRVLFWLQPRVKGPVHARALADLAKVNLNLKKIPSARAWASRGQRLYKDFTWTDAGKTLAFGDLRDLINRSSGNDSESRLPQWKGEETSPGFDVPIDGTTNVILLAEMTPLAEGVQMLAPVETSPAFRPPNLLFYRKDSTVHVYDTAKGAPASEPLALPRNADTALLGVLVDRAIFLQNDAIIGIDLKTRARWTKQLTAVPGPRQPTNTVRVPSGAVVEVIDGMVHINGSRYGSVDVVNVVDENGNPRIFRPGLEPDPLRRAALQPLGALRFTSLRMLNGKLYLLTGNQVEAINPADGTSAWQSREGQKIIAALPPGNAVGLVGNEDLIVVQVDSADSRSSTFCAFDAETGKVGRQIKLEGERALWRGLGDDGMLYLVTSQSVTAWDMLTEQGGATWKRTGMGSKFAGATALTLDGLVVINDSNDVFSLALDSGETRWTQPLPLSEGLLISGPSAVASMRSYVEGDQIIFQSIDGCAAFFSPITPGETKQLAWNIKSLGGVPPRQSLQLFDVMVIEQMAATASVTGPRTMLGGRRLMGGKMIFNLALSEDKAPALRSWQALDGGVAIDAGPQGSGNNARGNIYFLKTRPKIAPLAPDAPVAPPASLR